MMESAKLKTDVCCDVCACVHNVEGCLCSKEAIKITKEKNDKTAHFCKSFECKKNNDN